MKKIDAFTNRYSVSKTLRFKLIPEGRTAENFDANLIIEKDERRAEEYQRVKKIIDRYHKIFIEKVLSTKTLHDVDEYAELYMKANRSDEDSKKITAIAESMRSDISKWFKNDSEYENLFNANLIRVILPAFVTDDEEKAAIDDFYDFSTYFYGFHENRKNMYSGEGKSTEIAFRIVNQNLPKYLDNCRTVKRAFEVLDKEDVDKLAFDMAEGLHTDVFCIAEPIYFNSFLAQSGIDTYNQLIGGYSKENGEKVKGINEYINLYNQTHDIRVPKLKPLYKQILSDRGSISFIPEKFSSDCELLQSICAFQNTIKEETHLSQTEAVYEMLNVLSNISNYSKDGIYVSSDSLSGLSNKAYGSWGVIRKGLENIYDEAAPSKSKMGSEKYYEKRDSYFKSIKSYSVKALEEAALKSGFETDNSSIVNCVIDETQKIKNEICSAQEIMDAFLAEPYPENHKLISDDAAISVIKNWLDSIMNLLHFAKMFAGSGIEEGKDDTFYGDFSPLYEQLSEIVPLYNMIRNYVTQRPYSDSKIKLNFDNSQFLGGWDRNKEPDYSSVLLRRDGNYYLAIMAKGATKSFVSTPEPKNDEEVYKKIIYKLLPGPNKMLPKVFFSRKGLDYYTPSDEVLDIYKNERFKSGASFDIDDCHKLIDFYKNAINQNSDWQNFGFKFSATEEYKTIAEFYREVKNQGYKISYCDVPVSYVDQLVNEGKVYLFRLYNKDFSKYSKGTPNLHTMYFNMLFDENNLENVVYALNGGAEMFYRKASIALEDTTIHTAGKPIANKNPDNLKAESCFDYDIVKNRRYTERQFEFHVPITMNFQADEKGKMNLDVRQQLKACEDNYVIGIDRGERNLLYVCVVNSKGEIVEQFSLNDIIDENNGTTHKTDYHRLLDEKEKARLKARQEWTEISNISNLKEGYISQVIHKICELVEKYDAVIAMEDLNSGFKNSRVKVEKQVYQKFEKALIDKLNYMVDKRKTPDEVGGLLNAYQLTEKFKSFTTMGRQNGFIFYVPAWLTSKIDPTTGFVDLLKPRYESVGAAQKFFASFDKISYNNTMDWFEFALDYRKFPRTEADYQKVWLLATQGERIKTFRNPDKNNEWDNIIVNLTNEFKALFDKYNISYKAGSLQQQICDCSEKEFFVSLIRLTSLMLQMRNSITGTDVDYLTSPVLNSRGEFYNSNSAPEGLPANADANGAYNIARKALWAIQQFKQSDNDGLMAVKISISNAEWLEYVQKQ